MIYERDADKKKSPAFSVAFEDGLGDKSRAIFTLVSPLTYL